MMPEIKTVIVMSLAIVTKVMMINEHIGEKNLGENKEPLSPPGEEATALLPHQALQHHHHHHTYHHHHQHHLTLNGIDGGVSM